MGEYVDKMTKYFNQKKSHLKFATDYIREKHLKEDALFDSHAKHRAEETKHFP